MSKPDKRQRHKAKREAKRLAARRRASVSPIKRLAEAKGEPACWISEGAEEMGQVQIFAHKQGAGLSGIACFLVDRGVVGLKDAWTRLRIDQDELNRMLDASEQSGIPMRRATLAEVRRWVAGGIRWAHDNGMRLPKEWHKPASLIGGVGDWTSADVSSFVKEFAGHPEDLRQRLLAEPFDTYVQREDVDFDFSDAAPYMDQETGAYRNTPASFEFDDDDGNNDGEESLDEDELEEIADALPDEEIDALADRLAPPAQALEADTTRWLASRGETPSAELFHAWRCVLIATMLAKLLPPGGGPDEGADFVGDLLDDLSRRVEPTRAAAHRRGVDQALAHLQTDPKIMERAVLNHGLASGSDKKDGDSGTA